MARAGFCDQCGENVWLAPDGSCPRGHGAEHISGSYEAGPQPEAAAPAPTVQGPTPYPGPTPYAQGPAPYAQGPTPYAQGPMPYPPAPAPQKSHSGLIVAIVLIVIFGGVFVCGILVAIAVPIFNAAKISAQNKLCYANERVLQGAIEEYRASNGKAPTSLDQLVSDGIITKIPVCPNKGTYLYDPTTGHVTCSVHGSYSASPNAPPTP